MVRADAGGDCRTVTSSTSKGQVRCSLDELVQGRRHLVESERTFGLIQHSPSSSRCSTLADRGRLASAAVPGSLSST